MAIFMFHDFASLNELRGGLRTFHDNRLYRTIVLDRYLCDEFELGGHPRYIASIVAEGVVKVKTVLIGPWVIDLYNN